MKKNYVPIIREKRVHVPSRTVEEFLADSVESRATVTIMLNTYKETLTKIHTEYFGQMHTDELAMQDKYNLICNTISTFFNNLLDALELSCLAKEAVETINSDFDSLCEQILKFHKNECRESHKIQYG